MALASFFLSWKNYNKGSHSTTFQIYLGVHSKRCSIKHVATKVHITLWSYGVLTWMHAIKG